MAYNASMRVWRGDESSGALQNFTVEVNEGEVVLDIIHRLQQTEAPDLAVRWNCRLPPTPASTMIVASGSCSRMIRRFAGFWTPRPEPIGAASGMMAAQPASNSFFAMIKSSLK